MHSIRSDECKMLRFLTAEKLKVKYHIYYLNLFYNITPYKFCKRELVSAILFCHKIKYVNLGLLIWLFYFDLVDSLLQFIERNSVHFVSKRMLLII